MTKQLPYYADCAMYFAIDTLKAIKKKRAPPAKWQQF